MRAVEKAVKIFFVIAMSATFAATADTVFVLVYSTATDDKFRWWNNIIGCLFVFGLAFAAIVEVTVRMFSEPNRSAKNPPNLDSSRD